MTAEPSVPVRKVHVWDMPTRLFHWSLVLLILASWFTGGEDDTALLHRASGMALAGLIVFRIVWGFIGGEHARFLTFIPWPGRVLRHVKQVAEGKPERHLGHNPVGGGAVFLLLGTVSLCVVTGLMSSGEGLTGPFAAIAPFEMSEVHEASFRVLLALVVVHLLGVAVESWIAKDALVPAMVTGSKVRRADEAGTDARRAPLAALIVALLIAGGVSAWLWSLPSPAGFERSDDDHGRHDRDDRDWD